MTAKLVMVDVECEWHKATGAACLPSAVTTVCCTRAASSVMKNKHLFVCGKRLFDSFDERVRKEAMFGEVLTFRHVD